MSDPNDREDARRWELAPLAEVIDHILRRYHRRLDEDVPRLDSLARTVLRVHGDKDPRIAELARDWQELRDELVQHMHKEEQILFPWIRGGQGATAGAPIQVMQDEHERAFALLDRIRANTDDYAVPEAACETWRALWERLEAFEDDLRAHIHLENEVLFPRALAG